MNNTQLLVSGGVAVFALLVMVGKSRSRSRRERMAMEITRVGTSPVSLLGRILVTGLGIVGVQWFVVTHSTDRVLWWVVLGLPALVSAFTVTRATTVTRIDSRTDMRRRGDRR